MQVKSKFTVDDYPHYIFTPRDLTEWILGLLRYDLSDSKHGSADSLLAVWAYQAKRLIADRLVGREAQDRFDNMLQSTVRSDWSVDLPNLNTLFYVTWGATGGLSITGNVMGSFGRPLGLLSHDDFRQVIRKGLVSYG